MTPLTEMQKMQNALDQVRHFQAAVDAYYALAKNGEYIEKFLAACTQRDVAVKNFASFFHGPGWLACL